MEPVPLRESIVTFVAIAHFVRKHVAVNAWPSAIHSKLRTLQLLGQTSTRKGLLRRPVMEQRKATGRLLIAAHLRCELLRTQELETLGDKLSPSEALVLPSQPRDRFRV